MSAIEVIDPTKVGPFGVCLICFAPRAHNFCLNCGCLFAFNVSESPRQGTFCENHPHVLATTMCVLCDSPVCPACIEREGFSLLGGMPTPQCRKCVRRMEELQQSYRARLERDKICAKHSSQAAVLRCTDCHLPHCESCLFFLAKGWIRKKLRAGPLCLV